MSCESACLKKEHSQGILNPYITSFLVGKHNKVDSFHAFSLTENTALQIKARMMNENWLRLVIICCKDTESNRILK